MQQQINASQEALVIHDRHPQPRLAEVARDHLHRLQIETQLVMVTGLEQLLAGSNPVLSAHEGAYSSHPVTLQGRQQVAAKKAIGTGDQNATS